MSIILPQATLFSLSDPNIKQGNCVNENMRKTCCHPGWEDCYLSQWYGPDWQPSWGHTLSNRYACTKIPKNHWTAQHTKPQTVFKTKCFYSGVSWGLTEQAAESLHAVPVQIPGSIVEHYCTVMISADIMLVNKISICL